MKTWQSTSQYICAYLILRQNPLSLLQVKLKFPSKQFYLWFLELSGPQLISLGTSYPSLKSANVHQTISWSI